VVGASESDATSALTGAGFVVVADDEPSESVAAGLVIAQNPSEGVMAAEGTKVRIAVSTGPAPTASPSP
jgi:serine/threonine-protein kinase